MIIRIINSTILLLLIMNFSSSPADAKSFPQPSPEKNGAPTPRPSSTLDAVRDAERSREIAMLRGDLGILRSLFSDYYYHVESNGRVRSKTQLLQSIQRGEFKFLNYKIEESEFRLIGTAAIVAGRFTVTREFGKDEKQYSGRFIRIWEFDGNRWRNTMHQATEVKSATVNASGPPSDQ